MHFWVLLLYVLIIVSCGPSGSDSSQNELIVDAQLLNDNFIYIEKKFTENKRVADEALQNFEASHKILDQAKYALKAHMADAQAREAFKEFEPSYIKLKAKIKENPSSELKSRAKSLKTRLLALENILAQIKNTTKKIGNKEEEIINKILGSDHDLANIQTAQKLVDDKKTDLDKKEQDLSALQRPDNYQDILRDIKNASSIDKLKEINANAGLGVVLKTDTKSPDELAKDLRKIAGNIKKDEVQKAQDDADAKGKLQQVVNFDAIKIAYKRAKKNLDDLLISKDNLKKIDAIADKILNYKSPAFWIDQDRKDYLQEASSFTDLFAINANQKLLDRIKDFSNAKDIGIIMTAITHKILIEKEIRAILINIKNTQATYDNIKITYEDSKDKIKEYKEAKDKASKADNNINTKIQDVLNNYDLDSQKNIRLAADELIRQFGAAYKANLDIIFGDGLDNQKNILINIVQDKIKDRSQKISDAQAVVSHAQSEYKKAQSDLTKAISSKPTNKQTRQAKSDAAQFLVQAYVQELIKLFKSEDKWVENATYMSLLGREYYNRIKQQTVLHDVFLATDEPVKILIEGLNNILVKSYPSGAFAQALYDIIEGVKLLIDHQTHKSEDSLKKLFEAQRKLHKQF